MCKRIMVLTILLLALSVMVMPVSAKGNTTYDDWVVENVDMWETSGDDVLLKGTSDGYVGRVVYGKKLDAAKGFYIQWDILWEAGYEMINANWGLKVVGADKDLRFGSRVKSLCGTFALEVSYLNGAQWVGLPITNSNWKRTDFFARMVLYVEAGSNTLNIEARDVNNEVIFSSSSSNVVKDAFFTYPLEFWMGGDDSHPFTISNVTVFDGYDGNTLIPEEAAEVEVELIAYESFTLPTLSPRRIVMAGEDIGSGGALSTAQIMLLVAGGTLLAVAVVVAFLLLRTPSTPKKR